MGTFGDQQHYTAGNRLVTREIRGVKVGLAICYDACQPQVYAAYQEKGTTLMLHSFYNAGGKEENCLDAVERQVPTRCADNRMGGGQQFFSTLLSLGEFCRPPGCHDCQTIDSGTKPA